MDSFDEILV